MIAPPPNTSVIGTNGQGKPFSHYRDWLTVDGPKKPDEWPGGLNEWDCGNDPGPIPPRQWLLGNVFCRSFVSSVVAGGGVGKTALRLVQYISLALGRPLSGQHVFQQSRVLIISLEDDQWEMERRIKAILDYYHINRNELHGWLFCACPKLAKLAENKNNIRVVGPLERQIRDAIDRRMPDLVALDPFVKTHALEENDAGDMDFVCSLLARLAIERNIAVDAPHHVHKGTITPGDADSGRGSSGIKDAGRLIYTLCAMSDDEAATFSVPPGERKCYVRLDAAKINIAVHPTDAVWFKLVSVAIGNATPEYPNGDHIQVVEPWNPPLPFEGLNDTVVNTILNDLAKGLDNGQRYSNSPNAEHQAWMLIKKHRPDKPEAACRQIIGTWLKNELITPQPYDDPVQRKQRKGLYVNDSKRPGAATIA